MEEVLTNSSSIKPTLEILRVFRKFTIIVVIIIVIIIIIRQPHVGYVESREILYFANVLFDTQPLISQTPPPPQKYEV